MNLSYTIDVFHKKDQVQIMTGNAALGGLGGLIGFFLSSSLPVLALPVGFKILFLDKSSRQKILKYYIIVF